MNCKSQLSTVIAFAALTLGSAGAFAQSGATAKLYCHAVGASPPEALGDREGHAITVGEITCRVEGGPPMAACSPARRFTSGTRAARRCCRASV